MAQENFHRLGHGEHGKPTFFPQKGERVMKDSGFTLFVYHSNESYDADKYWWYVVEATSGLAVSNGKTKREAIELAESYLKSVGRDIMQKSIDIAHDRYGWAPGYQITYL